MPFLRNRKGYLTLEAAIVLPVLLMTSLLFVVLFFVSYKSGVFLSLSHHAELVQTWKPEGHLYDWSHFKDRHSQIEFKEEGVSGTVKPPLIKGLLHFDYKSKLDLPDFFYQRIAYEWGDEWIEKK